MLVESARIARGNIKALSELDVLQYDAVVFPGGFGAAKNLYVIIIYYVTLLVKLFYNDVILCSR